jgi:transcriptional regulator with XRE-family HTH domain
MHQAATPIGTMFKSWREQRHVSQLALATEAEISQKHLSFIESGRSAPSRDMVLRLAEHLDIPLRERNALLLAAGFAPMFQERSLDDPALARAKTAIELVLKAHAPNPALAVDRHWNLVATNAAVAPLIAGVDPELVKPPINVMRLSLHPRGLAPLIVNLAEWRSHLLERLRRQHRLTLDPAIDKLLKELSAFGRDSKCKSDRSSHSRYDEIVVPLKLRTQAGVLSFFSTVTVFGTAVDITLSELSLEAFYPADHETAEILRRTSGRSSK